MLSWITSELVTTTRIGRGGMAEVFRGYQLGVHGFRRQIAVKRMLPAFSDCKKHYAQFVNEAQLHSKLHHDGIVPIFSCLQHRDDLLLVMALIEGKSLNDLSERLTEVSIEDRCRIAVSIGKDIASALEYAHRFCDPETGEWLNLVHRDVTPNNIMLSYDGSAKLLDFGIAKSLQQLSNTRTLELKGTVCYLAPEYLMNSELDHRCDLFSLGVVLWELIANRNLFDADTPLKAMIKVKMTYVPSFHSLGLIVPPKLEAVIRKLLAQDPNERYQNAEELVLALRETLPADSSSDLGAAGRSVMNRFYSIERAAAQEQHRASLREIDRYLRFRRPLKQLGRVVLRFMDPRRDIFPGSRLLICSALLCWGMLEVNRSASEELAQLELSLKRPPFFEQLLAWYGAEMVGTADAKPLRIWVDRSRNHYLAIQEKVELRPTLRRAGPDQTPVLNFEGSQFLMVPGLPSALRKATELSVVVLGRIKGKQASYFWALQQDRDSLDIARLGGYWGNRILLKTKPVRDQSYAYSPPVTLDQFAVVTFVLDRNLAKAFVNGTEVIAAPLTERAPFERSGTFAIGQKFNGSTASDFLLGDIAQLMVFDKALDVEQRLQVQTYLARRYGALIGN